MNQMLLLRYEAITEVFDVSVFRINFIFAYDTFSIALLVLAALITLLVLYYNHHIEAYLGVKLIPGIFLVI